MTYAWDYQEDNGAVDAKDYPYHSSCSSIAGACAMLDES